MSYAGDLSISGQACKEGTCDMQSGNAKNPRMCDDSLITGYSMVNGSKNEVKSLKQ